MELEGIYNWASDVLQDQSFRMMMAGAFTQLAGEIIGGFTVNKAGNMSYSEDGPFSTFCRRLLPLSIMTIGAGIGIENDIIETDPVASEHVAFIAGAGATGFRELVLAAFIAPFAALRKLQKS